MALTQITQTVSPQPTPPELRKYDYDLVIVGGGIVGLTLASALKDSGLNILLIEAKVSSAAVAKGQAYAVHLLSALIYQGIGIWDKILPQIAKYRQVRLSDADYPGVVEFETTDLGTPELGYVAEHQALLEPLQEFVQNCPNVTYLCPAEVVSTNYQQNEVVIAVKIADQLNTIRSKLLVAADGSRSPIRQAAGIKTHGWKYWQSCIVAFVKPEKPHNDTAYERFWPSGPFAILPLPGNRCRIVWTAPHDEAKALCALNDEEFLQELSQRFGKQMGKLELLGDRFVFQVQLMQSDRYVLPRLALVGDAAHNCHPVGGQGLNLGIRDVAALAQVIQKAHQAGEDIGNIRVLKRYESWRQKENLAILGFTDMLDRMFSNQFPPLVFVRRLGLWFLQSVPALKTFMLKLMIGLKGKTPELAKR
ncbi:2-octaprenyl-3-methyl-6-methoxy-1,4-benzoquinol hydroxylase [Trichormus variabilis ATCC 29413]|uniref:2-octaprenyl-3-methyl-6-methoxy-1,4-benzoquinol hydroxylase n=2 Tax=Anabaena variabilis TaxID=264691 RepID=Q3MDT6_TRIV2|nr:MULTISPECIES: FAD-dependent hydroxylase [Nostocaceae]ABA20850.1 2-octaprenyl-3-methyl-6-methoxy-1,4-benzoquinol hydroxylase [Trichormus variabilis ATCC 29413]MBC1215670.1 FAD-dependent hydroxylase [Trichormus variabilis ARAD]MBC1254914.1 FAD-dependent hydroxylase [Trichormus variabilis V5]MBC1266582.1 FAD-dependent hydroxylase [Trichormus variabilis FSR]MBC1302994.1 FAD-dependent hydroxylase [Trichormus variabilis N2B]